MFALKEVGPAQRGLGQVGGGGTQARADMRGGKARIAAIPGGDSGNRRVLTTTQLSRFQIGAAWFTIGKQFEAGSNSHA